MYLVVTRTFPPEIGGMQNLMWGLTRSLSKINLIKVFADYSDGHEEFDRSVSFSIERVSGIKVLRKYRKAYLINEYLTQNHKVQCIIADHWKSLELIKTKKKKICLIHSKEINHKKDSRLNHKVLEVLNNVDHIVANSNFTKKLAIDLGVEEKRIMVINPGVDPAIEIPKSDLNKAEEILKGKKQRLITVSRFEKRKNHEKVIMAIRNLKEIYPDIIYTCIGRGDDEENLKKLVIELKLEEQLIFLRDIPNDLKNALVAKSNVFIMPSIIHKKSVEGFGIAFVEAAQYAIPSIGGKDGGASDAIIHEKTGLICDGNNLDEIYSSIDALFKDNKHLEYGKAAKLNSENFLWNKLIEKYKIIL